METYLLKKENALTSSERRALRKFLTQLLTWSPHVKKYLYWSSRPNLRVMLMSESNIIGSLSIVKRNIHYNGKIVRVAGIGNVGVRSDYQGKGYAQRMLRHTERELKKEKYDIALLFCDEKRTKLYERVGFKRLQKDITFYSKSSLKREPVSMALPLMVSQKIFNNLLQTCFHIGRGTW